MTEQTLRQFAADHHIDLSEQEPMRLHTTFHIGGPARFFASPETPEQLALLLDFSGKNQLNHAVVGNGSNLLVPDEGYDGLVIRAPEGELRWLDEVTVQACAGYSLSRLASAAAAKGLAGLAFAQGIPGTVGGALVMNAGAYGGQIADVLLRGECITPEGVRTLTKEEHELGYRTSVYAKHPDWIASRAVFRLTPGDPAKIAAEMADYAARRREKQPLEYPSGGSTFKRPEGHFAGKLIEDCGLKGFAVGGAQVSEKHAGFVINRGNATCADVLELMRQVSGRVYDRFGVRLEPEIRLLR